MSTTACTHFPMRVALILALAAAAAGCASSPKVQLADVREVFTDPKQLASGAGVPAEATKTAVYEVPFEDVFRLANISASQAQLSVEEVQKNAGLIFATRAIMKSAAGFGTGAPTPHRFFYAISVQELGPKSTRVRVMAKLQGKCETDVEFWGGPTYTLLAIGSVGIGPLMGSSINKQCEALRVPHWAINQDSAETEISQFFVFLRNNLLAARLL